MTTAAAEGAAIPGAAAKTAPTLDEALNIAGGTLHFEPYMPGEVVCARVDGSNRQRNGT